MFSPQRVWTADGRGGQQHTALTAPHREKQGGSFFLFLIFNDEATDLTVKKKKNT